MKKSYEAPDVDYLGEVEGLSASTDEPFSWYVCVDANGKVECPDHRCVVAGTMPHSTGWSGQRLTTEHERSVTQSASR